MRTFFRNEHGVGAIEFALIAPMLAIVLMGIMSGWAYYTQNNFMRDAVEVAARFVELVEAARIVEVNKTCVCAGAAASCTNVCSDSSIPEKYWTIEASSVFYDPFFVNPIVPDGFSLYEREVVRVR